MRLRDSRINMLTRSLKLGSFILSFLYFAMESLHLGSSRHLFWFLVSCISSGILLAVGENMVRLRTSL